jgi:hypothetical protein
VVTIPDTWETSKQLANGARWCTARQNDDSYFGKYSRRGTLYIVRDKTQDDRELAMFQLYDGDSKEAKDWHNQEFNPREQFADDAGLIEFFDEKELLDVGDPKVTHAEIEEAMTQYAEMTANRLDEPCTDDPDVVNSIYSDLKDRWYADAEDCETVECVNDVLEDIGDGYSFIDVEQCILSNHIPMSVELMCYCIDDQCAAGNDGATEFTIRTYLKKHHEQYIDKPYVVKFLFDNLVSTNEIKMFISDISYEYINKLLTGYVKDTDRLDLIYNVTSTSASELTDGDKKVADRYGDGYHGWDRWLPYKKIEHEYDGRD